MRGYVTGAHVYLKPLTEPTSRLLMAGMNGILFLYAIHAIWTVALVFGLMVHLSQ